MAAPVVLLGPQGDAPDVGAALAELGVTGRVALVTAGHQTDEADDAAVIAALGVPALNLRLHARANEVFTDDPEFATAYQARQLRLRNLQSFYRIRLDKLDDAARMISVRYVEPELLEQEDDESVELLRHLDGNHLERCAEVRAAFDSRWRAHERPSITKHREELRAQLEHCKALVITGGHVASLLNRLALFDTLALARELPIIAWSAGAMVLTERIVLFHDYPPYGSDIAQVLEAGLGIAPGLVVLPDPRRRVRLDNREGIARFARRVRPATCLALAHGARVVLEHGRVTRALAARLDTTGDVQMAWTGGMT
jgi:hypothetical protein